MFSIDIKVCLIIFYMSINIDWNDVIKKRSKMFKR